MVRTVTAVTYARKIIMIPLFLYLSHWPLLSSQRALSDSGDVSTFKPISQAPNVAFVGFYICGDAA
jgi:hypothetical protein